MTSPSSVVASPHGHPGGRSAACLVGICVTALLFGLEISSVPTVLPVLGSDLDGTFGALQWVVNGYVVAVAAVLLPTGALADRWGRRRMYLVAIAGFGVSSLLCGVATSVELLVPARALQGLTGGAMLICQVAVLSHQFPSSAGRARAFGAWGVSFGAGLGFGPLLGAALAVAGWRWVFLGPAAVTLVAWIVVRLTATESAGESTGPFDYLGAGLLSTGVLAFTIGATRLSEPGWLLPGGIVCFAVAAVLLIAFVIVQRGSSHPMVPPSILANRTLTGALWGSVGMNVSFWPMVVYLPLYLERGRGVGLLQSGVVLLALTLPTLLVPPFAERLALRMSSAVLIPIGLGTIGVGFLLVWAAVRADAAATALLPGLLVAGVGLGLTNTPVTNTATGAVEPYRAGIASGIDMSARMITLATSVAGYGLVLVLGIRSALVVHGANAADWARQIADGSRGDADAFGSGLALVSLVAGIAALVAAAGCRLTFRTRRR